MNKFFKDIGAILSGFISVVILSVGTDALLEKLNIFPSASEGLFVTWMLVLAFIYRSIYAIVGGYVTAKLTSTNPMRNVKILGFLGIIGGVAGVVAGWNLSDHWYPIALAVTAFPLTWFGGKLKKDQQQVN